MSYQVFARKYRPQTFDQIVGQEHIVRTLRNAIEQQRLAHAYLFVGPRGVGKTSTARILAKALNCERGPTLDPCGECDACREIAAGNSLDVLEIDGASNNSVDQMRELRENVRFAPTRGRYKIYLIDEVHMLTTQAFNALLKTLEEPPAHVIFIFATTEPQKVLATILSRCQRFDLRRIPADLIAAHLQYIAGEEKIVVTPEAAATIAKGAEGGLRDAESMLDQLVAFCGDRIEETDVLTVFGFTSQDTITALCGSILNGDTPAALETVHAQAESGKDLSRLMADLIGHLRNLLVLKADPKALAHDTLVTDAETLTAQSDQLDLGRLLELVDQCAEAEGRMKWAPNKKLHFEIAVIKAIQTLSQATLDEVIDTLSSIRGGGAAPAVFTAPKSAAPPPRIGRPVAKTPTPKPAPAPVAPAPVAPAPPPQAPEPAPAVSRVREEPSKPVAPAPAQPPADLREVWTQTLLAIRDRRPLVLSWAELGTLLELADGRAVIAFPADQTLARDSLSRPSTRVFLGDVIGEVTGRETEVECVTREGLVVETPALPEKEPEPEIDPMADFRNDDLIKAALDIFKGELAAPDAFPQQNH